MQHLKLFIFTILLAEAFFHVQGSPAGEDLNDHTKKAGISGGSFDAIQDAHIINGPLSSEVGAMNSKAVSETSITGFGSDKEYTHEELESAFSDVTLEYLTSVLGLNAPKTGAKSTNLVDVLTHLLIGLSLGPKYGVINYETAMMFSGLFTEVAPETSAALKTVLNVMMALKQQQTEATPLSTDSTVVQALLDFYGPEQIDEKSTQTWTELVPLIHKATQGNEEAAKTIINFLSYKIEDLNGLRNLEENTQLELVQTIIQLVADFAQGIKSNSS